MFSMKLRLLASDIDGTLLGNEISLWKLLDFLKDEGVELVPVTGRDLALAEAVLDPRGIHPRYLITDVGTRVWYNSTGTWQEDQIWSSILDEGWNRELIESTLSGVADLVPQDPRRQGPHKVSYDTAGSVSTRRAVQEALSSLGISVKAIFSGSKYLDILPKQAGKGEAVRFLANRMNICYDQVLTAGDSGNDEDMLTMQSIRSVVVGNYLEELEVIRSWDGVHFAESAHAAGILEGIAHWFANPTETEGTEDENNE